MEGNGLITDICYMNVLWIWIFCVMESNLGIKRYVTFLRGKFIDLENRLIMIFWCWGVEWWG